VTWLETFGVGPVAADAGSPAVKVSVAPDGQPQATRNEADAVADAEAIAADAVAAGVLARGNAELSPAVVIPGGTAAPLSDDTVPQQIGRTVGRAATKAADLLANLPNLPKFGRKK
jgi:hypothetical protein